MVLDGVHGLLRVCLGLVLLRPVPVGHVGDVVHDLAPLLDVHVVGELLELVLQVLRVHQGDIELVEVRLVGVDVLGQLASHPLVTLHLAQDAGGLGSHAWGGDLYVSSGSHLAHIDLRRQAVADAHVGGHVLELVGVDVEGHGGDGVLQEGGGLRGVLDAEDLVVRDVPRAQELVEQAHAVVRCQAVGRVFLQGPAHGLLQDLADLVPPQLGGHNVAHGVVVEDVTHAHHVQVVARPLPEGAQVEAVPPRTGVQHRHLGPHHHDRAAAVGAFQVEHGHGLAARRPLASNAEDSGLEGLLVHHVLVVVGVPACVRGDPEGPRGKLELSCQRCVCHLDGGGLAVPQSGREGAEAVVRAERAGEFVHEQASLARIEDELAGVGSA